MSESTQRAAVAGWLTQADPAGLLYGAIVSAGMLAAISAHADDSVYVGLATTAVLVVYWMAHVYIYTLSGQFRGDNRRFLLRLRGSAGHEASVLKGGLPAILIYFVTHSLGLSTEAAANAAVYFSVAMLAAVGYLGAHKAGLTGRAALLETAGAASFGVLIVIAKSLLH